ncbi:MAG TPA: DUF1330 domain-containing protein [Xanthobacteraceae bacterium]|nr:DUF1330 domain-containing protein [Xanthobacteraceae bacterium]
MKRYQTMALSVLAGAVIGAVAVHGLHAQAKPPAYAIVENDVRNPEAYAREFAPLAGKALIEAGGKFLARRGRVVAVDGEPPKSPVTVLAFENVEKAQAAFAGPYREARKIGDQYATHRIYIVEGLPQ